MVRALHHHLTASVVKYGHSVLCQTGFLEGQEVPNPEIVSNGKLYPSLIEDKCVIHHLGLDLLLASCVCLHDDLRRCGSEVWLEGLRD
jgi:hypothetical protein